MNSRRAFVATVCTTTCLAGCLGDDENEADTSGDEADDDETGYETRLDEREEYDLVDRTGEETVEIAVAPDGEARFEPDSVEVDEMAEVTWTWSEIGYEIYPIDTPDPCGWSGDDHGTSHSWEFPFVGKYEIGCTTPDGTEFEGVMFVV
ncbi:hypothetical protein QA600_13805 [Natronococcus sp. A-GB1]|uniref:hypothetical protein n=1 Tax=Natronococcus sp. A-GB1 TaxID=3037648 RepID=UPI00241D562A|nr:hypothetical protein [Natronococcus sp. A-GB1]MDG5760411.1 hypothetical protein [Natronococcus sp. A-GB1]